MRRLSPVRVGLLGVVTAMVASGCMFTGSDEVDGTPEVAETESAVTAQGELAVPVLLHPVLFESPCDQPPPTTPAAPPEAVEATDRLGNECFVLDRPVMEIDELTDLRARVEGGMWIILLDLTDGDGVIFEAVTTEYAGDRIAIVVDDEVVSAPQIVEPIVGGKLQISGQFTRAQAEELIRTVGGR